MESESHNSFKVKSPDQLSLRISKLVREKQGKSNIMLGYGRKSFPSLLPQIGSTVVAPQVQPISTNNQTDSVGKALAINGNEFVQKSTAQAAYVNFNKHCRVQSFRPTDKVKDALEIAKEYPEWKTSAKDSYTFRNNSMEPLRYKLNLQNIKFSSVTFGNSPVADYYRKGSSISPKESGSQKEVVKDLKKGSEFRTHGSTYDSSCREYGKEPQINPYLNQYYEFVKKKSKEMQKSHLSSSGENSPPAESSYKKLFGPEAFVNCLPPKKDPYKRYKETMEFGDGKVYAEKSEAHEMYPKIEYDGTPVLHKELAKIYKLKNDRNHFGFAMPMDGEMKKTPKKEKAPGKIQVLNAEEVKKLQKSLNIITTEKGVDYVTEAKKIEGRNPLLLISEKERPMNYGRLYKKSSIKFDEVTRGKACY